MSIESSLLRRYAGNAPALPEQILEVVTREACRRNRRTDCATFLARWIFEDPDSTLRQATLAELRKNLQPESRHIEARHIREQLAFYTGQLTTRSNPLNSTQARRLTSRFLNYNHHAVPFDLRALEEIWRLCRGDGCDAARARFEKYLWELDLSPARRADSD